MMRPLNPGQVRWRGRVEALIRIAEPGLNLVLTAGERLSRLVERGEDDYYPPQRGLPPGTRTVRSRDADRARLDS